MIEERERVEGGEKWRGKVTKTKNLILLYTHTNEIQTLIRRQRFDHGSNSGRTLFRLRIRPASCSDLDTIFFNRIWIGLFPSNRVGLGPDSDLIAIPMLKLSIVRECL